MTKPKNYCVALKVIQNFQNNSFGNILQYFTDTSYIYYHGELAKAVANPTLPVIPFAGQYIGLSNITNFLTSINTYANVSTPATVCPPGSACCCSILYITVNLTIAPKNGSTVGTSYTIPNIFKFTFDKCHRICSLDIFLDTSYLTQFFLTNPVN